MADSSAHAEQPSNQQPQPELKDRFREALERKKQQHADGVGGPNGQNSKIHEAHGRAGGKRQFRRKSG
ncbi:MAG TPA: DUF5302 domain-containing protein [Jatrophihabitans sp.]|nr:DUF5302 domain-containing protein [Jatrophihabitans sp.]